jgi:hypothetical protein
VTHSGASARRDSGVVGRTIDLGGDPYTIVRVMPASFQGLTGRAELSETTMEAGPGVSSSRSAATSAAPNRATARGSNCRNAARKASRFRSMVIHDRPDWNPSRMSGDAGSQSRRTGRPIEKNEPGSVAMLLFGPFLSDFRPSFRDASYRARETRDHAQSPGLLFRAAQQNEQASVGGDVVVPREG